ncbi:MAG TPA: fumarylacetoacetate hydrolase family protein [Thermoanaerobaculia bacterium]|jgi:2-keto-4-pentenoate hydratase/2-oxohepta-3-ene-1,7-dioic acid hydratase in catechol pathway|nr:fumarylacetoacetate hydrolase family protein [Thermoanaerobaculia bacterium]
MLLYRIAPEGFWAVAESAAAPVLRILYSDPLETLPGGWEYGQEVSRESAPLLVPVQPSKIVCVGRNYVEHARELNNPMPEEPLLFLKAPSSLTGPNAPIVLPPESQRVEHEGEIAVVLRGRLGRGATPEEARSAVLGITCANDVTARDLQRKDAVFARSKSFDTFCPVGPAIRVPADIADLEDLEVVTRVNGAERQRGHARDMAFGIVDLLLYSSRMMTLEPGDVLLTGTPAGVGPLVDGDRVEVEVSGVGVLSNPVEAWKR